VDLSTQRSVRRLDRVNFAPAATSTRQARDAAARLLERVRDTGEQSEQVMQELQLLAEGNRSDYEAFFEPLLYESTALDHLAPEHTVLFDDFEDGQHALTAAIEYE